MSIRYYFNNFGMDEDIVENVKSELNNIKSYGTFIGEKNNSIYYEFYKVKNEKKSIVISHGFTECIEKYIEIIYYFIKENYSVFIMEHRGHGRSGALGVVDKTQINVEDFNYYIKDFKDFIDNIVLKVCSNELILFSHSMGGAIGLMFLEKYPNYFNKAIISSPLLSLGVTKIPNFIVRAMARYQIFIGKGGNFILGNMPYESTYNFTIASTSNESRYSYYYHEILNNNTIQRGGGSYRWLYECLSGVKYILKNKNIQRIKARLLVFQSGRDDLVGKSGIKKFIKKCDKAKLIKFDEAKHEIYLENNNILEEYLNTIFSFINKKEISSEYL